MDTVRNGSLAHCRCACACEIDYPLGYTHIYHQTYIHYLRPQVERRCKANGQNSAQRQPNAVTNARATQQHMAMTVHVPPNSTWSWPCTCYHTVWTRDLVKSADSLLSLSAEVETPKFRNPVQNDQMLQIDCFNQNLFYAVCEVLDLSQAQFDQCSISTSLEDS